MNEDFPSYYQRAVDFLSKYADENENAYLVQSMLALAKLLKVKTEIQLAFKTAYKNKDEIALREISEKLTLLVGLVQEFYNKIIYQWERENKPFGCECIDLKLGGLLQRTKHTKKRLDDYLAGKADGLPELEKETLDYLSMVNYDYVPNDRENCNMVAFTWKELITGGIL